jgi:hypothetical protein
MFREIAQIVLAIQLSSSHLPISRTEQLAKSIKNGSEFAGVDPFIIVAIATHESGWNERTISDDGEDLGLLQIRGKFYGGKNEWLLSGENNIRVGSYIIKKDIEFCEKQLKRAPSEDEWLSCYAGQCTNPAHWCKPTSLTKQFVAYEKCLENAVSDIEQESAVDCKKKIYHY